VIEVKKAAVFLVSVLAFSMMLMAVTPVLAKPNTMTVILKDSAGKPVYPAHVYIINLDDDVQQLQPNGYVNRQGKVNIPTPGDMYARPWAPSDHCLVIVQIGAEPSEEVGEFYLDKKCSARITITLQSG